jgi:hypothetical protein
MTMSGDTKYTLEIAHERIKGIKPALKVPSHTLDALYRAHQNLEKWVGTNPLFISEVIPVIPFAHIPMLEQLQAIKPQMRVPHEFLALEFTDVKRPQQPYLIEWSRQSFTYTLGGNALWAKNQFTFIGESACTLPEVLALLFHLQLHETKITRHIELPSALHQSQKRDLLTSHESNVSLFALDTSCRFGYYTDMIPWILYTRGMDLWVQSPTLAHGYTAGFPSCRILEYPFA